MNFREPLEHCRRKPVGAAFDDKVRGLYIAPPGLRGEVQSHFSPVCEAGREQPHAAGRARAAVHLRGCASGLGASLAVCFAPRGVNASLHIALSPSGAKPLAQVGVRRDCRLTAAVVSPRHGHLPAVTMEASSPTRLVAAGARQVFEGRCVEVAEQLDSRSDISMRAYGSLTRFEGSRAVDDGTCVDCRWWRNSVTP